jgi:uncharacterized membrane protein
VRNWESGLPRTISYIVYPSRIIFGLLIPSMKTKIRPAYWRFFLNFNLLIFFVCAINVIIFYFEYHTITALGFRSFYYVTTGKVILNNLGKFFYFVTFEKNQENQSYSFVSSF